MNVIFHAPSRARCRSAHLQPTSPAVYFHPDESSSSPIGSAVRREEQTVIIRSSFKRLTMSAHVPKDFLAGWRGAWLLFDQGISSDHWAPKFF